jgi:peptidoglycan hydrolase CwlO-like protein
MKKSLNGFLILIFALLPLFAACESKKLQEENAGLKKQVDVLTKEKMSLQSTVDGLKNDYASISTERDDLKKQVDDLTMQMEEMKTKMKPAKKPSAKTKK